MKILKYVLIAGIGTGTFVYLLFLAIDRAMRHTPSKKPA